MAFGRLGVVKILPEPASEDELKVNAPTIGTVTYLGERLNRLGAPQ